MIKVKMANDIIAALEIGTTMVRSVVCEIRDDDSISVLALSEIKNKIEKVEIFDRNEAINSVKLALKELNQIIEKVLHLLLFHYVLEHRVLFFRCYFKNC